MRKQEPFGLPFQIGDAVLVSRIWTMEYQQAKNDRGEPIYAVKNRVFNRHHLKEPVWGQITGLKTAYYGSKSYEGDDCGWVFHPKKSRTFLLVRFGMRNKEELIINEDCIEHFPVISRVEIPDLYQNHPTWTDLDRKALSNDIKQNAKRDSTGRFVKMGGAK